MNYCTYNKIASKYWPSAHSPSLHLLRWPEELSISPGLCAATNISYACVPAVGASVYPGAMDGAGPMVVTQYTWSGAIPGAMPISVEIFAAEGNPLSKFVPTALTWAAFGDGLSVGASPPFPVMNAVN